MLEKLGVAIFLEDKEREIKMFNHIEDSTVYNVGDLVVFGVSESKVKYRIGMILKCNYRTGYTYSVMSLFNEQKFAIDKDVSPKYIRSISYVGFIRNEIIKNYETLITMKKAQLLTVEKDKKALIRNKIIQNCEMIVMNDCLDDDSFMHRVTKIVDLQKQLLDSGKSECSKEISMYNERVKRECKELEVERDNILKELSSDSIESICSYMN